MPNRFDFGGVDLTAGESPSSSPQSAETPFCVAIFGDFSGRASRGLKDAKTLGERRPILVDRDNFDEVLAGLKVELHFATEQGDPPHRAHSDHHGVFPSRTSGQEFARTEARSR